MENPVYTFFNELKQMVVDYVSTKLQLVKIKAYEKIAAICAVIFSMLVLLFVFLFLVNAFTIAAGAWLNEMLHSNFLGYVIVAGVYLFLFLVMIVFRKQLLVKPLTNIFIKVLFKQDEKQQP